MPDSFLEPSLAPHFQAWKKSPGPETTDRLLQAVHPILDEALRTYGGASSTSPNLRSRAKQLALDAMGRYDPRQAKLRTHLLVQLQGLRRHAARQDQAIRLPEQMLLDRRHVSMAENDLRETLGRDPSDAETADKSGFSLKRIAKLRTLPGAFAESTLTHATEEGASLWEPNVQGHMQAGSANAWASLVYHDLDPIDQVILEHSLGLHNKPVLANQDIAHKLKISPGAVSQRRQRIQTKLDTAPLTGLFG